jgi:antitoxin component YwqK of YwqJK toxin-antitoxin module
MENINQKDSLGRRQGKWISYKSPTFKDEISEISNYLNGKFHGEYINFYGNNYICHKKHLFNNQEMNYCVTFNYGGTIYLETFYHQIF